MTPARIRRWVNWALVVAAGVSVVATVLTRNAWTSAERLVRETHLVVGFRQSEIQRVSVTAEGQQVVLARAASEQPSAGAEDTDGAEPTSPGRWLFVEPYQGEAEEAAVDALLRTIEFAAFTRKVDDVGFDRHAAGLDAPLVSIELVMGQVRTRLHFGNKAPAPASTRYVEVGGEGTANKGVYVVAESTAKELSVRPDAFQVRQVVPYGATSLASVTLRDAAGRTVRLRVGGEDDWQLEGSRPDGGALRLDADAVARLFAALARSRADQFVAESALPPVAQPLGPNEVEATFVPKASDKGPLTMRFGGACPADPSASLAVRVSNPPLGACTVPLHLESFVSQLPGLVDKRLFATALDSVEELSVQAGQRLLELARREQGWTLRKPEAGAVERDAGDGWVESLLAVRGELVAKPDDELQTLATLVVQRARVGTEPLREVVEVFRRAATVTGSSAAPLIAHRPSDDAWLEVSAKHLGLFEPNALLLKSSQLLEAEVDQVKRVRVQTPRWTEEFEYRGTTEGCHLVAPAGQSADGALCLDVLDELRVLRAKRWVSALDDGSFGLSAPTLRVEFTVQAKAGAADVPVSRVLVVGSRASDASYFAQLTPDPAVFSLRPSVVETLSTLVLDRSPFMLDAQALESLVVRRSTAPELTLRRLGDELVSVGSSATPVTGLIDALALLRPEAAVELLSAGQVASAPPDYGFRSPLLEVRGSMRTDGVAREFHWVVGRGGLHREQGIYYAMPVGVGPSAVFALPREAVQRILDAL